MTTALQPDLYVDPAALAREQDAIFARSWQLAGHVSDLAGPGRFLTAQVGAESVLVVRGQDGELRAFRNVCRHRAARLREGRGDCGKAIRCPYHGWTYRTDGSLIGVPEGRGFPGLDKSDLGLLPARAETFAGLVFVTLDDDLAPLAEHLSGLEAKLAPYGIERMTRFSESFSSQPANWKIVADKMKAHAKWRRFERDHFVYRLGPPMHPPRPMTNGKIYPAQHVKCALDTLLSGAFKTVREARDETQRRYRAMADEL